VIVGCPHPNEPIGGLSLDWLSQELVTNDKLRDELDATWYLIKCIDPDGTRLNEGWFDGQFDLMRYASEYFRPPHYEQYEWSYPIRYRRLLFNRPIPETRAIMSLVEREQPHLIYSLHNCTFSGVHYYCSRELHGLYEPLIDLAREAHLPLTMGLPRMPGARRLCGSVSLSGSAVDFYEMFAQVTPQPELLIEGGTNSSGYFRDQVVMELVSEVPLWHSPLVGDTAPSQVSRGQVRAQMKVLSCEAFEELRSLYDRVWTLLTVDSPFKRTVEEKIRRGLAVPDVARNLPAKDDAHLPATLADEVDSHAGPLVDHLLDLGQLTRTLECEIKNRHDPTGVLAETRDQAQGRMGKLARQFAAIPGVVKTPIEDLVRVQLGAAFATLKVLRETGLVCGN
jgi:hypothetical protein